MKSQPVRINSILRRSIRTALTLSLTLGSLASAAAFPINETFKTNSSANFTLGGTPNPAILTAGGVDPATDGWLRLTNNTGNQTGYAFYNPTFSSAQGVVVEFDYATWGGSGADGISFFLFDGTATSRIGAFGGSLGYAQKSAAFSGTGSAIPGVSKGYVGIGLDEFGNYSNAYEGRVGGFAGDVQHPSYVVIRGPGDGASTTDYPYLSAQPAGFNLSRNGGTARPSQTGVDFRHVRLIIQPDRKASVSVTNGFGAAPTNVINNFQLATTPPATYKLGFGASTGGATNYHELRNLVITAPTNLAITKTDGVSTLAQGGPVTYTVTVTNNGQSTVTGATMADTLPASINNVTWACVASVGSTCTDATGTGNSISAKSTLAVGGTATYTINGTLSATAALASTVTNTATVAAPAENTDSDLSDNTASDSDTVTAPLAADLSIN
ncbi:hypothetical protein, partial [Deinococcus sp.]|uniref:hypothetical protein n=1 Tax=Deinococcus sp. TaxID=47478 RepID=UPI0025CE0E34